MNLQMNIGLQCDGATLPLSCKDASQVVVIKTARYGRPSPKDFAFGCGGKQKNAKRLCPASAAVDVLSLVKEMCHEKKHCALTPCPSRFGATVCPDVPKYLEVTYECVSARHKEVVNAAHYISQTAFSLPVYATVTDLEAGKKGSKGCCKKAIRKQKTMAASTGVKDCHPITIGEGNDAKTKGDNAKTYCVKAADVGSLCKDKLPKGGCPAGHPLYSSRACDPHVGTAGWGHKYDKHVGMFDIASKTNKRGAHFLQPQFACAQKRCISVDAIKNRVVSKCENKFSRALAVHGVAHHEDELPKVADGSVESSVRSPVGSSIEFRYSQLMDFDRIGIFWAPVGKPGNCMYTTLSLQIDA